MEYWKPSVRSHGTEPANSTRDQAISSNLLAPILGLAGIGLLACAVWALGLNNQPRDDYLRCPSIADDHARLACYDNLNSPRQPAKGALVPLHPNSPKGLP